MEGHRGGVAPVGRGCSSIIIMMMMMIRHALLYIFIILYHDFSCFYDVLSPFFENNIFYIDAFTL